jgi:adenylate cyclase
VSDDRHTFLFMDLVGFTALTAEQGDDNAADVALRLYRHVRRLLPEHSGEEVKTIGDAMMVRCDAPVQGLELGLRIAQRVEEEPDLPPLRIAVHTGSAVCRDGDWYGNAVNVAARLCSAAGGGELLVSDATREAVGAARHVNFGSRRLHWLKNVPEPIGARSAERITPFPPVREWLRHRARLLANAPSAGGRMRRSEVAG